MQPTTIRQLHALNLAFYDQVAESFSSSRQQPWQGWTTLLPFLGQLSQLTTDATVLDLGCGNGRFCHFLANHFSTQKWEYTGVDTNRQLLNTARSSAAILPASFQTQWFQADIVNDWSSTTLHQDLWNHRQYDLVVAFGLLHHIPSEELRRNFVSQMLKLLTPHGLACLSFWQFTDISSLMKQAIPVEDGESGDYLLTWQGNPAYLRYCHEVGTDEEERLVKKSGGKAVRRWEADGHSQRTNHYLILKPEDR